MDKKTTVEELRRKVRQFIDERDWRQFHTAKNMSTSMAIEVAELMEIFQWHDVGPDAKLDDETKQKAEHEIADIVIYAMDFCNTYGIDLSQAIVNKLKHNEEKYPADQVRGKTHKYTYYQNKDTDKNES